MFVPDLNQDAPRQTSYHLSPMGSPTVQQLFSKIKLEDPLDTASVALLEREKEREAHEYKKECEQKCIHEGVRQIYVSRFITIEVEKKVCFIGGRVFQIDTSDGNQYVGECSISQRNGPMNEDSVFPDGMGTLKTAWGTCYHGEWVVNFPHGRGEMILPNGLIVEGAWVDGQLKRVYR